MDKFEAEKFFEKAASISFRKKNDYYPFGMMQPGRKYSAGDSYRYGFNGKENDNEVKGEGSQQDYGMRIYDPRLGRFLSVDPLQKKYAFYTPYQFGGNMPIRYIDLDGLEPAEPGTSVGQISNVTNKGDDVATSWKWNGSSWEESKLNNVTVYSRNYHKPIGPVIKELYDNQTLSNSLEVIRDIAKILWDNSELKKELMEKLPKIPGLPSIEGIIKDISEKYAPGLHGAGEALIKNRDNAIDLAAAGVGIVYPYVGVAYELIIKRIFVDDRIKDVNLGIFNLVDANWENTAAFNHVIQNQPMLRGGEFINAITVTAEQFYQIMGDKVFLPSNYNFYPIDQYNLNDISRLFFNGDQPAFNIYFNSLGKKGFLHISEVGVAPINIKLPK